MLRRGGAALAALLTLAAPHAALADGAAIAGVRMGFNGMFVPERWCPAWVTVTPGDEPESLVLSARYEQDSTQTAAMLTSVTTTPGRAITVPMLLCPPLGVGRIDFELAGGRRISRMAIARSPSRDDVNMHIPMAPGALLVGTLGTPVPASAVDPWRAVRPSGLDAAGVVPLQPADVGETWPALSGLSVLVARQSALDSLAPAKLDAVAAWLGSGGRLVLIADGPGAVWRRFVPPGVFLADTRPTTPPKRFRALLGDGAAEADLLSARAVTLDPGATAMGWRASQTVGDNQWLIADGPCGGGLIVIAAFDPALASATLSEAASAPLWTSLIERAIPDVPRATAGGPGANYFYAVSSGDGAEGAAALASVVNTLCSVPAVPRFVYALIVLLTGALALAVSVGDFVVLGRFRSRHRSWITASAWLLIFGLVSWQLPRLVRGDATSLSHAQVCDSLPGARWRVGVTSVFASTSGQTSLMRAGRAPAGFWRGVSVLAIEDYRRERDSQHLTGDLPLLQRVSAMDGSDSSVAPGPGGVPLRQWTLRTFQDFEPDEPTLAVAIVPGDLPDRPAFTVAGLPPQASLGGAAVQTAAGWATLTLAPAPARPSGTLRLVSGVPTPLLPGWRGVKPVTGNEYPSFADRADQPADGERLRALDGARGRTPAFDALARGGGYAVVHLLVHGPSPVSVDVPHSSRGLTLYRVAVPLPPPGEASPP